MATTAATDGDDAVAALLAEEEKKDPHPVSDTAMAEMARFMQPVPLPPQLLQPQQSSLSSQQQKQKQQNVLLAVGQSPLDACADVLLHCCNCLHTMGAGIARSVRERFPAAYAADAATPYGDVAKLGTYSCALVRDAFAGKDLTVVNVYAQFDYGRGGRRRLCYKALRLALGRLLGALSAQKCPAGVRIATYWLGCSNAGGDRRVVRALLERTFAQTPYAVAVYTGAGDVAPAGGPSPSLASMVRLPQTSSTHHQQQQKQQQQTAEKKKKLSIVRRSDRTDLH